MDWTIPRPAPALVVFTQLFLGALFLIGIGAIAILPMLSSSMATTYPEYAELRTPLLALAIAFMLVALIALAMIALLVHRIHNETVLTRTSLLWVDVIITSLACAVALIVTGFVVIGNGQAGSPFLALVLVTAGLTLTVLACITLVLRSLLRHAILMRAELDEVV